MATPSKTQEAGQGTEEYKHLYARPDNWRRQLWLKGRNMTVGHLVYGMRANGMLDEPEAAAANWALPLEQVLEALDYYRRHRDIIEADSEEEKRWLIEQGYSLEPRVRAGSDGAGRLLALVRRRWLR